MSRSKDALPRALLVTFIPLLLQQGALLANSLSRHCFYDTVYLDRNGTLLRRVPDPGITVTFIVRTTKKTEDLYGISPLDIENVERGISHPITLEEAEKTEDLIKAGKFEEAFQTGNLVELRPLAERQADGKLMLQDNGRQGDRPQNNREYATVIYNDGNRIEMLGVVSNPHDGGEDIKIPCWETVRRYSHSHASGIWQVGDSIWHFSPQAPSRTDILAASGGQTSIVFGRDSNLVYIYNSSGVIAVLPTKVYLKF
ncbi:MAG TPA: hypothetical protein VNS58_13730 [Puia sp.]|nr:hypothetical protein [Puia sp.]